MDKDRVIDLYWRQRLPLSRVARELQVGVAILHRYMKREGISRRRWGGDHRLNVDEAVRLYSEEKLSMKKVAATLGFSIGIIHRYLKRLGLTRNFKQARDLHLAPYYQSLPFDLIKKLYSEGESAETIALGLGIAPCTVRHYMETSGVKRRSLKEAARVGYEKGRRVSPMLNEETRRKAREFIRPTKPERKLIALLEKYKLPYRYVGNGAVWFEGCNPDFININGAKGIIEIFGDYWHTGAVDSWSKTEGGRIYHFSKFGFKTLILWENELENEKAALKKIKVFTQNLKEEN